MNFNNRALNITVSVFGAIVAFIGIAGGVAFYHEVNSPLWLKDYERAEAIQDVDKKGAIALLRRALIEAEEIKAPPSDKKQITQKLGDLLYANFAQSDMAKMTQTENPPK